MYTEHPTMASSSGPVQHAPAVTGRTNVTNLLPLHIGQAAVLSLACCQSSCKSSALSQPLMVASI